MAIQEDDILFVHVNPNQHGQTICTFTDKYGVTITTFYSDLFLTKHSLWEILESYIVLKCMPMESPIVSTCRKQKLC